MKRIRAVIAALVLTLGIVGGDVVRAVADDGSVETVGGAIDEAALEHPHGVRESEGPSNASPQAHPFASLALPVIVWADSLAAPGAHARPEPRVHGSISMNFAQGLPITDARQIARVKFIDCGRRRA